MPATRFSVAAICTLLWFGAAAGAAAQDHDPDAKIAGGGTVPTGWRARTDKNRPLADAKIQTMGTGLHATLGPAVILWRDRGLGAGNYRVVATFTQTVNPRHPEGYGLVVGGSHLADAQNGYTYFLVRGDGKVLVKRRVEGDATAAVRHDTTDNDAVVEVDRDAEARQ